MGRKKVLEDELNDLEGKLQRAEKLVTGTPAQKCCATHEKVAASSASQPAACLLEGMLMPGCQPQQFVGALHCRHMPVCLPHAAGLAGERVRWEASIGGYENFLASLPGDAMLAAAFLSYAGPFPSEFRDELVKGTWVPQVMTAHSVTITKCQSGFSAAAALTPLMVTAAAASRATVARLRHWC
jgi:hypothetical protein